MENQQTFMTDPWTKWFLYRRSIWLKVASMGFHVGLKKHHFSMGIRHGKKKTPKNITKFLRRRPEARHFQIPKVQIFR